MHRYFDPAFSDNNYCESFWEQLHIKSPHLFNRDNALHLVRINQNLIENMKSLTDIRNSISDLIARLFDKIDNHGFRANV